MGFWDVYISKTISKSEKTHKNKKESLQMRTIYVQLSSKVEIHAVCLSQANIVPDVTRASVNTIQAQSE